MVNEEKENSQPRIKPIVEAADTLSLGISMVVAVVIGVGIGLALKSLSGESWSFWIGVFIGVSAAILNVYKAYSKQYQEMLNLSNEPRYAMKKQLQDDEDDDEDAGYKSY